MSRDTGGVWLTEIPPVQVKKASYVCNEKQPLFEPVNMRKCWGQVKQGQKK